MDSTEFWTICSSNGIVLSKAQLDNIERYAKELIYWNQKINLISRRDEDNVLERHILHSLTVLKNVDLKQKAVCLDIGTGGGLPGIPLKIAREDLRMLLIDSIAKKVKTTQMLAKHTGLRNIDARQIRAEELARDKEFIGKFDCITARAVTHTSSIIEWSKAMLKREGKIVLLKGGDLKSEISDAEKQHTEFSIVVKDIDFFGVESFQKDEKKIVVCSFK